MKMSHYAIVFAIFAFLMLFSYDLSVSEAGYLTDTTEDIADAFDIAVDAATGKLISGTFGIEKDEAVDTFYRSLYSSFGVLDSAAGREELRKYVPVIAVSETDGIYFRYRDIVTGADGTSEIVECWSGKVPYTYSDPEGTSGFIYRLTTDGHVTVYDTLNRGIFGTSRVASFDYDSLTSQRWYTTLCAATWSRGTLLMRDDFWDVRLTVISNIIESYLSYYVNNYNSVARYQGITYEFQLPMVDSLSYGRAADGPAFLAFFQGYAVYGTDGTYNRYSVANAKLSAATRYNVYRDGDGTLIYHDSDCSMQPTEHIHEASCYDAEGHLTCSEDEWIYAGTFLSIKECQLMGAYSCTHCLGNVGVHADPNGYITVKWNQLLGNGYSSSESYGVSVTADPETETLHVSGGYTGTSVQYRTVATGIRFKTGHEYYIKGVRTGISPQFFYIRSSALDRDYSFMPQGKVFMAGDDQDAEIYLRIEPVEQDWSCEWGLELIDLTEMYEGIHTAAAFEELCDRAGIDLGVYHARNTEERIRVAR